MASGAPVIIVIIAHPQKGQTPQDCRQMAEAGDGAYAYDEFGTACWAVYGKEVKIEPTRHSIMEGFQITNYNFRAGSTNGALPNQNSLPGDMNDSNTKNNSNNNIKSNGTTMQMREA